MPTKLTIQESVTKQLRPQVIAAIVEALENALLWGRIFVAHLAILLAAFSGIDPDIIRVVSFMEKWVWIGAFAAFFVRVGIRLIKG